MLNVECWTLSVGRSVRLCLAVALLLVSATTSFAADPPTVERVSGGWINWEKQVMKAVGHGVLPGDAANQAQAKLMARQAAVADAYRNLASVTKGVRVTGQTSVKNFITESDDVRLKVEGFIRGAEVISEKQLEDASFEVILQAPLTGEGGLISGLKDELLTSSPVFAGSSGDPSGLLIDATGLGVLPAMSPKIYDEDGKEVYGTVYCSPDFAIEVGIVGYPRRMEQALKSDRIGKSPLTVKALRRGAKFATDVVVSNADAARIRAADAKSGFLSRCSVAIFLGK